MNVPSSKVRAVWACLLVGALVSAAMLFSGCNALQDDLSVRSSRTWTKAFDAAIDEYDLAMDLIVGLEHQLARQKLEIIQRTFANLDVPEYIAKCLFWQGYCSRELGDLYQARQMFLDLIACYPQSREAPRAEAALAAMHS